MAKIISRRIVLAVSALLATTGLARAAESVVIYSAAPQNLLDVLVPAFEKASGVKVSVVKAGSGELMNRLKAEASKPAADVIISVDGTVVDVRVDLLMQSATATVTLSTGSIVLVQLMEDPAGWRVHGFHAAS